ncbi:VWA domain-containing protein [Kiritimatiellaeota bacterium B1221]|nr:VWA domain-containing protein [Kiritimatiellaeota bacterium B1221]
MNNELTEIWMILDRSGSMQCIHSGTVEAVNSFIKNQQKEEGEGRFTLRQFDDEVLTTYDRVDLDKVPMMKLNDFEPRGCTALYDAVGSAIIQLGKILDKTPEADRPGSVIFTIITDGMENASQEFTGKQIADMIDHQKHVYDWEFLFLGANIDVDQVAGDLNIAPEDRISFSSTDHSVKENMAFASTKVLEKRERKRVGR